MMLTASEMILLGGCVILAVCLWLLGRWLGAQADKFELLAEMIGEFLDLVEDKGVGGAAADEMGWRICTQCGIRHIDNCGSCFGFGVERALLDTGSLVPITAGEALGDTIGICPPWLACPECGSTPAGVPEKLRDKRGAR